MSIWQYETLELNNIYHLDFMVVLGFVIEKW